MRFARSRSSGGNSAKLFILLSSKGSVREFHNGTLFSDDKSQM
jgi:hypothetical protein